MRTLVVGCLLVGTVAYADAPCELGIAAGKPIVCARDACWAVDVKTGAVAPQPGMTVPPGHAREAPMDAAGCSVGYCTGFKPGPDDENPAAYVIASTDGAHVGVIPQSGESAQPLYIFDARTRKLVRTIPLVDPKHPDGNTSVTNMVHDAFYLANTVYVVGADAGAYEAAWAFRDDGTRLGVVGTGDDAFITYAGSANIADDAHVALADSYMEHVLVVSVKDGSKRTITRAVKLAPCTEKDLEPGADEHTAKCARHLAKELEPYVDAKLVVLPDGRFVTSLGDKVPGLAILDPKRLTVTKRLRLKVCR